jgi:pimeloyl-ACP methyl ester carboxylesterase
MPEEIADSVQADISARNPESNVVILVHGIRTFARWVPRIRKELECAKVTVVPTNYDYFDLVRFLMPWRRFRRKPIASILAQIRAVIRMHPEAKISVLAHSFGSYVVGEIIVRERDIKFHKVVFCGSIVPLDQFDGIADTIDLRNIIINEVGTADVLPALADSVTRGYGRTGTYGFQKPWVRDRWHNNFHHSQFLTAEFCNKFWVPVFTDQPYVEGDTDTKNPPLWVQLISIVKIKNLIPILVLAFLILQMWLWWPSAFRVTLTAPEKVGYLGPTIQAVTAKFQEPCNPLGDWLILWQRRCANVDRESDAVKSLVVRQPFDVTSRDPLTVLLNLRDNYSPCLVVRGIEARRLQIDVDHSAVEKWEAPDGTIYWLCQGDAKMKAVLARRHGG